jgi:hypothetical protein
MPAAAACTVVPVRRSARHSASSRRRSTHRPPAFLHHWSSRRPRHRCSASRPHVAAALLFCHHCSAAPRLTENALPEEERTPQGRNGCTCTGLSELRPLAPLQFD